MKSLYSFLTFTLISVGLSVAQSQPSTNSTTSITNPTTTTVTSTSTNRQQDLYDEYHGITKKPAISASTPVRPESPRQANTPTPVQSTETASQPQRISSESNSSGVRIGVRGGITYPLFTEKLASVDPAVGFVGGLTFNFGGGTVSFQPEVNYTRYSTKNTDFGLNKYTESVDLLEVPLFLKISSGTYAGSRFFVNVGPYASYVLSTSIDGQKESLNGLKGRFGFGAALGVGAALKAGPGHVTVEVRGLYSLGNTESGFNTDSKTIFIQPTLGYIFPLGGR
ncbi:porin family protein [Spirosoma flavum]|uniref:Porin family protein n=1 Tax=Spirosoma flavum TaxID=2048557 RepID=A0ABW6AJN3_9BACT